MTPEQDLILRLNELVQQWREHDVDPWVECTCARCAYDTCADQLAELIGAE